MLRRAYICRAYDIGNSWRCLYPRIRGNNVYIRVISTSRDAHTVQKRVASASSGTAVCARCISWFESMNRDSHGWKDA